MAAPQYIMYGSLYPGNLGSADQHDFPGQDSGTGYQMVLAPMMFVHSSPFLSETIIEYISPMAIRQFHFLQFSCDIPAIPVHIVDKMTIYPWKSR